LARVQQRRPRVLRRAEARAQAKAMDRRRHPLAIRRVRALSWYVLSGRAFGGRRQKNRGAIADTVRPVEAALPPLQLLREDGARACGEGEYLGRSEAERSGASGKEHSRLSSAQARIGSEASHSPEAAGNGAPAVRLQRLVRVANLVDGYQNRCSPYQDHTNSRCYSNEVKPSDSVTCAI